MNKKNIKIGVVVPTIRENCVRDFLNKWQGAFRSNDEREVILYIMQDNNEKTFKLPSEKGIVLKHLCWEDIEKTFKKDSWIIPRTSDTVRSFGYFKAYQDECDYIITLDDDCYPLPEKSKAENQYIIDEHLERLTSGTLEEDAWVSTINGLRPRGLPYNSTICQIKISKIIINHGLWVNVPDLNAMTSFNLVKDNNYFDHVKEFTVPRFKYFPMCGMNLAWKREATPMMYFLLMGRDKYGKIYDYDRFGDIWCGLFAKKIADHLGYYVSSGKPIIYHSRASNKFKNLIKEASGTEINELLWKDLSIIKLRGSSVSGCYKQIARKLPRYNNYWKKLARAMQIWVSYFD